MNDSYVEDVDDAVNVGAMVATLLAHWWWIAISVVLFSALFITLNHVLTPVYRASIVLIPARNDHDMDSSGGSGLGGIGGVASLVGINLGGGDSETEEALGVLKSREFTDSFISDFNLMPVLFAKLWNAQTGRWKVDEAHQPTMSRAYRLFDKKIRTIVPEKKTSLITLNIDWTDRVEAARWANELVSRLNKVMREREMARADSAMSYLEKEFETTNAVATREAIAHLIEMQVKQRMFATVTQEFAFRVIDRAVPSDKDDLHFPNKFLMAITGPFVGLIIGVLVVLAYSAWRESSARRSKANLLPAGKNTI
jgi:uncharacterized protein involved in exopolysaccharide biosynthesis